MSKKWFYDSWVISWGWKIPLTKPSKWPTIFTLLAVLTLTLASGWALRENPDDALLIKFWKANCHFHMHISKAKLWHVGGPLTCSVLQRTQAWKGALAGCFSITLKTKKCHCVKRDKNNNYHYGTVLLAISIILPY